MNRKLLSLTIAIIACLHFSSSMASSPYPEVLFDNSVLPGNYHNSRVSYEGNSWIRNFNKSLPVSDSIYFTPNNALSLNYISGKEGRWSADVFYSEKYTAPRDGVLIFKMYIQSHTNVNELPAIQVVQSDSSVTETLLIKDFLTNFQENSWFSVEIPLRKIGEFAERTSISSLRFLQQSADGKEHQVYIDQIEILPARTPQNKLTGAAVLSSAIPFERHVDLYWQLPLTPSIRYIKIYRSPDNKNFEPVAIRPIHASKYSDVVDEVGKNYYYKIAWVDFEYRESPFSAVKEVQTRKMTDAELLDMVLSTNIQYFHDAAEINSGLQLLRISGKDAFVSTSKSAFGILAFISASEQKKITREVLAGRILKMVNFLETAESFHGAFPAILDGRTGRGVFPEQGSRQVDLEASSALIQALMVARQYLNHENEVETNIRSKISALCNRIEWSFFVKPGSEYLFTGWSPETEFSNATPLVGRTTMATYIVALSSLSHNIELSSFNSAMKKAVIPVEAGEEEMVDELQLDSTEFGQVTIPVPATATIDTTMNRDTSIHHYYGLPLHGDPEGSLIKVLNAFLVIDPRDRKDESLNYFQELQNLVSVKYRKSEEHNQLPISLAKHMVMNEEGWVNPSVNIASYPFHPKLAMETLISAYRNFPEIFWTEYGFRVVQLKENRANLLNEGHQHGLSAIMIENGKSGLFWDLFSKDPDVQTVTDSLFFK